MRRVGAAARGFTLFEMMGVLAIVALLLVFAVPSYEGARVRARLKGATTNLFTDLQYARSEAVQRNAPVTVSFTTGTAWCYGIHEDTVACDCGTPGSCNIKSVSSAEFGTGVSLAASLASYQVDPRRGQIVDAGGNPVTETLTLTAGTYSMVADVNVVGRVRLCSATIPGYPSC